MRLPYSSRQRGIALPIMLIMLTVMMVSSIYLLKSTTSTTMTTSNLAYEAALGKSADAGLHEGFTYLRTLTDRSVLRNDQLASGYVSTMNSLWTVSTPAFWLGAITMPVDDAGNQVQYVIHRLCILPGAYDDKNNQCRTTAPRPTAPSKGTSIGQGLGGGIGKEPLADAAQIHYVVTARVFGPRGGNVVTQAVVMQGP